MGGGIQIVLVALIAGRPSPEPAPYSPSRFPRDPVGGLGRQLQDGVGEFGHACIRVSRIYGTGGVPCQLGGGSGSPGRDMTGSLETLDQSQLLIRGREVRFTPLRRARVASAPTAGGLLRRVEQVLQGVSDGLPRSRVAEPISPHGQCGVGGRVDARSERPVELASLERDAESEQHAVERIGVSRERDSRHAFMFGSRRSTLR
jgi:hypothetical protein